MKKKLLKDWERYIDMSWENGCTSLCAFVRFQRWFQGDSNHFIILSLICNFSKVHISSKTRDFREVLVSQCSKRLH